jgi:hypothetical protein
MLPVPTSTQRAVILVGLLAILVVQLGPMFEDPTPLAKARQPLQPMAVVFMLFSAAILLLVRRIASESSVLEPTALSSP